VLKRWGYESADNDDADAYALMMLGLDYFACNGLSKERAALLGKLEALAGASVPTAANGVRVRQHCALEHHPPSGRASQAPDSWRV
jgi:hypothetical protein